jgi:branched-chain amino acid transport system substrate-binding protein
MNKNVIGGILVALVVIAYFVFQEPKKEKVSEAARDEVKLAVVLGFTGPAESLAESMARGAELAIKEVSASGLLLGGSTVSNVRADSTCVDASAAAAAAERVIASDKVDAIIGALCSGATISILQNVAMPKGVMLFSPSATSPALSTLEDNGLFFRASPSDARQGQVISEVLGEKGIKSIAMTYTNNDYGKGLADSIQSNFEAAGGTITINAPTPVVQIEISCTLFLSTF